MRNISEGRTVRSKEQHLGFCVQVHDGVFDAARISWDEQVDDGLELGIESLRSRGILFIFDTHIHVFPKTESGARSEATNML